MDYFQIAQLKHAFEKCSGLFVFEKVTLSVETITFSSALKFINSSESSSALRTSGSSVSSGAAIISYSQYLCTAKSSVHLLVALPLIEINIKDIKAAMIGFNICSLLLYENIRIQTTILIEHEHLPALFSSALHLNIEQISKSYTKMKWLCKQNKRVTSKG